MLQGKTATGADTWYVVTESSDQADAEERGVNWAPKLAKALGTKAVQKATVDGGVVTFPGTVDFAPERSVTPGPGGFPPTKVAPGDRRRGLQPARHDRREDGAERHSGRE